MKQRMLNGLGLLAITLVAVGCNGPIHSERAQLWDQNVELQEELERARAALDAEQNQSASLQARIDELERRLNATPAPEVSPFGDLGSGITSTVTDTAVTVRIPGDVLFNSGSVELRPEVQSALTQIADVIQSQYPVNRVRVEGYTDTDPIARSGWDDNLELSVQRAAAVVRYLGTQGVTPSNMYAAGFGEHHALATKEASRRVEIVVLLAE